MFHTHRSLFFLIVSIIALSLLLCAGLGVTPDTIKKSYNQELQEKNISDILLKTSSLEGFSEEEVLLFSSYDDPLEKEAYFTFDFKDEVSQQNYRFYARDLSSSINRLEIIEGRLPQNGNECLVEQPNGYLTNYELGEAITLYGYPLEVVGITYNPLYSTKEGELMLKEGMEEEHEYLEAIIYISNEYESMLNHIFKGVNEIALRYHETYSIFQNVNCNWKCNTFNS